MDNVLIIDDDAAFRGALGETLTDFGWTAIEAAGVRAALDLVASKSFSLILIDNTMPFMNGMDGIAALKARLPETPIVMITSKKEADTTVQAMKIGAYDFLTKPVRRDQIAKLLERVKRDFPSTAPDFQFDPVTSTEFICESEQMRDVLKMIGKVASTDAAVLITGETGTGKELIAKMIHRNSRTPEGPFVALNCAAIPDSLLESELFGHAKGSFTGATNAHEGAFLRANDGTLFLDEIGDMNPSLQAKLLRVLQEREVTPVGSGRTLKTTARFISATHRSLRERVRDGTFREDLYFRLNVIEIALPSLRERPDDIAPLAARFLSATNSRSFSDEAIRKLTAHEWTGNIRELRNVVERASILSQSRVVGPEYVQISSVTARPEAASGLATAVADLEKRLIEKALREAGFNRSEAARTLQMGRQQLYAKLREYGLEDLKA